MKVGDRFFLKGAFDRESLSFLRQMGADGAVVNIAGELQGNAQGTPAVSEALSDSLRSGPHWRVEDLLALKAAVNAHELELCSLAHTPPHRMRRILLGLPGRDEDIAHWCRSLQAMGEAGIPVLQYSWHLNVGSQHINWHTTTGLKIRGGALAEGFDHAQARDVAPSPDIGVVSEERMWESLTYFLQAVIPVAEKAGVRMALHPADPQVPVLAGVARIMRSMAAYDRMLGIVPSKANAMTFCQGCFSQMLDAEGVYHAIDHYAKRDAIALVHFRNVTPDSRVERFSEAFWDEGKVDMVRALRAYGPRFSGYITPDHHPHVVGDTAWGHRSRAFALGYIRGLVQSAEASGA